MNLPDLTTATKAQLAEVLASLDVRLTASQVKKASRDELLALVESQAKTAAKKPARRQPQTITVAPRGEVKPFRSGTIQAQAADMLRGGATIGDLRRVCIRKDGKVWKDSAIRGLFSTDMRAHGYGVRTELWNGFQLWQNCSWDDATSFPTHALNLGHPDDHQDHDAILAAAIEIGFDSEELHQVFFLVDPTASE